MTQRKYGKNDWKIALGILIIGLPWWAYEMYQIKNPSPERQKEQEAKIRAQLDKEAERSRLDEQRAALAQEIQRLMTESLQQCINARDADAVKFGGNLALVRYAECLQKHKTKFGIK